MMKLMLKVIGAATIVIPRMRHTLYTDEFEAKKLIYCCIVKMSKTKSGKDIKLPTIFCVFLKVG